MLVGHNRATTAIITLDAGSMLSSVYRELASRWGAVKRKRRGRLFTNGLRVPQTRSRWGAVKRRRGPKMKNGCRQETGTAWVRSGKRCEKRAVFYRAESAMEIAADLTTGCGLEGLGVRATHR